MKGMLFVFMLNVFLFESAYSQDEPEKLKVNLFFEGGYNTFDLKDVSDLYKEAVHDIEDQNINIKTQKLFPGNASFGGGILINTSPYALIKFGISYSSTKAYSLYGDYSGTIDVTGDVSSWNYYFGIAQKVPIGSALVPFTEIVLSIVKSECNLNSKIVIYDGGLAEDNLNFEATGLYLSPAFGFAYEMKPAAFNLKIGYKKYLTNLSSNFENIDSFNLDVSGLFITSGISFTLN